MCIHLSWYGQSRAYSAGNNRKTGGVKGLHNELMQIQKICQHPFLFDSVEDKSSPIGLVDGKLVRSSGKLELFSRILPKFIATGHRVGLDIARESDALDN